MRYVVALWTNRSRRGLALAVLSIPATVVMAGWKTVLFCDGPSLLIAATVMFNLGVVAAKVFAVHRHRRSLAYPIGSAERIRCRRTGFRWIGFCVTACAIFSVAASMSLLLGRAHVTRSDDLVAIIIAAVTFAELGVGIWSAVTARHDDEPLVEAIKLVNVAAAVILLVLTQASLLSISGAAGDAARFTGASGVFVGGVAMAIGAAMLMRRFPPISDSGATPSFDDAGAERERDELGAIASTDLRH